MKISWGVGIAIFYSLFVLVLLGFVYASTQQDNSLVSENYYEEDLNYQKKMDKIKNTRSLKNDFQIAFIPNTSSISVIFPIELIHFKGTMTLFHPAYSQLDQSYNIGNEQQMELIIPLKKLAKGRWIVKIDGKNEGKGYFYESYMIAL